MIAVTAPGARAESAASDMVSWNTRAAALVHPIGRANDSRARHSWRIGDPGEGGHVQLSTHIQHRRAQTHSGNHLTHRNERPGEGQGELSATCPPRMHKMRRAHGVAVRRIPLPPAVGGAGAIAERERHAT
jgi:hypothetical protein